MAEEFLSRDAAGIIKKILEPQYGGSIGKAAAWADGYRREPGGEYTYQWHWIDSLDVSRSISVYCPRIQCFEVLCS